MKLVTYIQFEGDEIETLSRALEGHANTLLDPPRKNDQTYDRPVHRYINRIRQEEPFDSGHLEELVSVLARLIEVWTPQTTVQYWLDLGAAGGADAVAGLALARLNQIDNAKAALRLVANAALYATQATTKNERMAEGV